MSVNFSRALFLRLVYFLTHEDEMNKLFQNVGAELPLYTA